VRFTFANQVTETKHSVVTADGACIHYLVVSKQLKFKAAFAGESVAAPNASKFTQLANVQASLVFGGAVFAGVWKIFPLPAIENHEWNLDEAEEFGVVAVCTG